MLDKTLESTLDKKEIKPVNSKENQPYIFIRRTNAETEAPILWPLDAKRWLIRKGPDMGKDWRQEKKGMTEDEMAGWHHGLNGHEFDQTERQWTGKAGVLQSMGSQRVRYDWTTEQKQKDQTGILFSLSLLREHCFLRMWHLITDCEFLCF